MWGVGVHLNEEVLLLLLGRLNRLVFYALVHFRGLTWEYSAETVAILLVVLAVGIIAATQKTLKLFSPLYSPCGEVSRAGNL